MNYQIKPKDTFFFRDGKPFTMGEDTWADTLFPPNPSTFLGAFRSAWFAQNIDQLPLAGQGEGLDPTGKVTVKSFFLKHFSNLLLPVPLDCVHDEDMEETLLNTSSLSCKEDMHTTTPFIQKVKVYDNLVETPKGFITARSFNTIYLEEKEEDLELYKVDQLFTPEIKLGIGRDRMRRVASEGQLFRVPFQRWRTDKDGSQTTVVVNIDWGNDEKKVPLSLLRIGGEGKCATVKESEIVPSFPKPTISNKRFKLYLATPTIFEHGFLPFAWNRFDNCLEGNFPLSTTDREKTVRVKLLQAFVGKYQNIGGFDMKKRCPKAMYRAVPSGSVYYFEIMDDTSISTIIDALHMQCISQQGSKEGLGYSIIGSLNKI